MFTNRHKYFYWTKRTAFITFAYAVVVPSIVGYLAYTTDVRAPIFRIPHTLHSIPSTVEGEQG